MDWHELRELVEDLASVRVFFIEIAKKQAHLEIVGLERIRRIEGFEKASEVLRSIETRLAEFQRSARFAAPEIHEKVTKILDGSPLIDRASEISLAIEIADSRTLPSKFLPVLSHIAGDYAKLFGIAAFKGAFDSDGVIPLRQMLIDLDRIQPLLKSAEDHFWRRGYEEDETFKPSGVDPEVIRMHIQEAIAAISKETRLGGRERENLEEYLLVAQAELVKSDPSWKTIVGALVIASTILGGLAVAPEAIEHVNSAIKYLLGTAFEGMPSPMPNGIASLPPTAET